MSNHIECKAALRKGPGNMECVTVEKPKPGEGKILVRIKHTGICGSDIARVKENNPKWDDVILGHEAVGIVEEISEKTSSDCSLNIGDMVAIIPLVPCHKCSSCLKGYYSLCQSYSFIGSRIHGTFSQYLEVDPKNLIKLPPDENMEKYALLEPLTVAIHAIHQTDIKFGKLAVIFGAGTIGLLLFQVLKRLAQYEVVMVDVDSFKLDIARKLGSYHNVCPINESLDEYIKNNLDSSDVDVVFEVSGSNKAITDSLSIVKPKGVLVTVGTPLKEIVFDIKTFEFILRKEMTVKGSWMSYSDPFPGNEWNSGINMLKNNQIEVGPLVTNRYSIEDVADAFNLILEIKKKYCKVLLNL